MVSNYLKKALEILREDGPIELSKTSTRFVLSQLDPQYHYRFKFHTFRNHLLNCIRYDAPPDPYKTIAIRPSKIEYRVGRRKTSQGEQRIKKVKRGGIARTKGGNWDSSIHRENVENVLRISAMIQRFGKNKDWEETKYYQSKYDSFNNDKKINKMGYTHVEQYLDERFKNIENLFNNIKKQGYKKHHNGSDTNPASTQPIRNRLEVLVTIDRDGTINFFEGQHRFGIARVLDIEIPAHVVCRHKKWQEVRDDIYNNGLSKRQQDEIHNHPDLQDILCSSVDQHKHEY